MPTDSLPVYLSTGVSFGVLAGIVSGVCYLITNKYIRAAGAGNGREVSYEEEDVGGSAECKTCRKKLMTSHLYDDESHSLGAEYSTEIPRPIKFHEGRWFIEQLQNTMNVSPWSISIDDIRQPDRKLPRRRHSHTGSSVREVLEQLSSRLAGGPLDSTSVTRLSSHPAYLPRNPDRTPRSAGNEESAPSNATGAHGRLKKLVARVVEEAMALPALARYANQQYSPGIDHSTYEDLLATAILNKVITRYQSEGASGSSGVHSASHTPTTPSPTSTPSPSRSNDRTRTRHYQHRNDDYDGRSTESCEDSDGEIEETVIVAKRVPFPEFGGDIVHTAEDEIEVGDDEPSGADLQAAEGSWEENWLFQKKKVKSAQSVPVPMLVPNSNADYKALIGDKDADDTSELSELASEIDSDSEEPTADIKTILVKSKTKIGGKLPTERTIDLNDDINVESVKRELSQELEQGESRVVLSVDSGPLDKAEFAVDEIHRTSQAFVDDNMNKPPFIRDQADETKGNYSSISSFRSNQQLDGEYEETESKADQLYANSLNSLQSNESFSAQERITDETDGFIKESSTADEDAGLIPGSIADRERKKWLNYVEMPNNPYSAEAIKRRLSNKSTSSLFDMLTSSSRDEVIVDVDKQENKDKKEDARETCSSPSPRALKDVLAEGATEYKRFGRDYYINEAKRSTGSRKKKLLASVSLCSIERTTSFDDLPSNGFTSPGLLIEKFNHLAETYGSIDVQSIHNKHDKKTVGDEQSLFPAKPVPIDDDTEQQFEELVQTMDLESEKSELSDVLDELISSQQGHSLTIEEVSSLSLSTSSADDSLKVYNVEKGEIVKSHRKDDKDNNMPQDKSVSDSNDKVSTHNLSQTSTLVDNNELHDAMEEVKSAEQVRENEFANLPVVKDLAKKFNENDTPTKDFVKPPYSKKAKHLIESTSMDSGCTKQYIHSLTARSISKEFRDELKLSMPTAIKLPGGANQTPEGTDELMREEKSSSPLPEPGTIKSKLAFFESLRGNTLQTSNF